MLVLLCVWSNRMWSQLLVKKVVKIIVGEHALVIVTWEYHRTPMVDNVNK